MTREQLAYLRGVEDALRLAKQTARALEGSPLHCTRKEFAIAALDGLAADGRALFETIGSAAPSQRGARD